MKVVFIILFLNLFSLSCVAQVDSLSFFLNSTKVDSIKSYDLLKYAYRLDLNEENDRAINALSKCSELALKENQTKLFIKSEKLKAFILIRTNRYDDAIKVASRLLAYSVKNKSSFGKAHSTRLFGIIETNKGNLDGSLKKHFEAQKLWEDTKDSSLIIEGLADIGTVFFYQKDYRSAIKYWKKTSTYYIAQHNFEYAVDPLSNMALAYIETKEYDAAEKIFNFILPVAIKSNDVNVINNIYTNMAFLEHERGNLDKAIEYTNQSIKALENSGELSRIGGLYSNLGELYRAKKDFSKAKENLYTGLNLVLRSKNLVKIAQSYENLAAFYSDIKNFELALAYKDTFYSIHDSIYTVDKQEQIMELEKRFDSQQKEKQIESLNKDREVQISELKKQRYLIYSFIVSSILIFVLIFFIYRSFKIKKEKEQSKFQLLLQNAELTALKAQMNPHFIFNALNSIQHSIVTNNTEDAYRFLAKFSTLIRNILDNSSQQLIPLKTEIETLSLYVDVESKRFDNSFHHIIHIEDNGYSTENILIPPMMLQPFIENAIWHGLMPKIGTKNLVISFTIVSLESCICEITDNGIGREKAKEIAAQKNKKHKSKGIANIYDRVKLLEKTHSFKITIDMFDCLNNDNSSNGTKIVVKFKKDKN